MTRLEWFSVGVALVGFVLAIVAIRDMLNGVASWHGDAAAAVIGLLFVLSFIKQSGDRR